MINRLLRPLLASAFAFGALSAQQATDAPSRAAHDHHAAFVRAFNAGTPDALRGFVRDHFAVGTGPGAEAAVRFWLGLRLEVGPLELIGPTRERRTNRVADIFWYRGITTGAYPGIELTLDTGATPRVRGYGVNRAMRPTIAAAVDPVPAPELPAALTRYFRAAADSGHFSGAVVVARHGRIVFEGAYGPADIATGRRNTLDTPFRLASVTKMFTGVAIMQLVEQGRLALDDTLAKFIPEYPAVVGRKVTVRHLLTHTSGIELDGDSVYYARVGGARALQDLLALQIERIQHLNDGRYANFAPLTSFDYSNEGIDLLAVIVERASGRSWREYLAERVFRPAGMSSTGSDFLTPVSGVPIGYSVRTNTGDRLADREPVREGGGGAVAAVRPAGSGYATARDMVAFMRALTNGTLLSVASARTMMSPHVDVPGPPGSSMPCRRAYGFTMSITRCGSFESVGHSGGAFGQSTVVAHYPDSGYTIVMLSNFDRVTWWAHTRLLEMLGLG